MPAILRQFRTLRFALAAVLAAGAACRSPTEQNRDDRLAAPQNLVVLPTSPTSIRVNFAAVEGAESYEVSRAAPGAEFTVAGTATRTWFDDVGLTPGTTYRYHVSARSGSRGGSPSADASATTFAAGERTARLLGELIADRTLHADTTYVLYNYVIVRAPATLRIPAGTRIVGDTLTPGATLVVDRDARIFAEGTADRPIVFTSQRSPGNRAPGDWGGVAIVGRARTNLRMTAETQTEGPSGSTVTYTGGSNDDDDSGVLRYVRIEFAGAMISTELYANSLSLYAVGRGTVIENVQVSNGLGDHFRWFGGTVDGRYLVSYDAGDHHYDATEGYRGRNQYMLALQTRLITRPTGRTTDTPTAFAVQGCERYIVGCTEHHQEPHTMPVFANFTAIGLPPEAPGPGANVYNTGVLLLYGGAGTWVNGIFARSGHRGVTAIDTATRTKVQRDSVSLFGNLFAANRQNFDPDNDQFNYAQASNFADGQNEMSAAAVSQLVGALPAAPATVPLDWALPAGSPARTGGLASFTGLLAARAGGWVTPTAYRGAVNPAGPAWWAGWTAFPAN